MGYGVSKRWYTELLANCVGPSISSARLSSLNGLGQQGFGELGIWNHWLLRAQQSHRAGPVVSCIWPLAGAQSIQADTAVLVGSTYGRNGSMFSLRIQYLF